MDSEIMKTTESGTAEPGEKIQIQTWKSPVRSTHHVATPVKRSNVSLRFEIRFSIPKP